MIVLQWELWGAGLKHRVLRGQFRIARRSGVELVAQDAECAFSSRNRTDFDTFGTKRVFPGLIWNLKREGFPELHQEENRARWC